MNIININVINKNNQLHIHLYLHFRSPPHLVIHLKKKGNWFFIAKCAKNPWRRNKIK